MSPLFDATHSLSLVLASLLAGMGVAARVHSRALGVFQEG
jgi:hypothetical protein